MRHKAGHAETGRSPGASRADGVDGSGTFEVLQSGILLFAGSPVGNALALALLPGQEGSRVVSRTEKSENGAWRAAKGRTSMPRLASVH